MHACQRVQKCSQCCFGKLQAHGACPPGLTVGSIALMPISYQVLTIRIVAFMSITMIVSLDWIPAISMFKRLLYVWPHAPCFFSSGGMHPDSCSGCGEGQRCCLQDPRIASLGSKNCVFRLQKMCLWLPKGSLRGPPAGEILLLSI